MTDTRAAFLDADPNGLPRPGAGWGWILGYGILSVLLGLAAFAWPFSATYAATLVIGAFFIIAGAVSIASGLATKGHHGRGYAIGFGIVSLLIGLIMTLEPVTGAISLTLLVATWLALRGVMEIVLGMRFRYHRGMMIALGVINLLLAILVLATLPISALTLPGYILGLSFLFGGITSIMSGLSHKRGAAPFAV